VPFEIAEFVDACRAALREAQPQLAVRDVVARATAGPRDVARAFEPQADVGLAPIHTSTDLTILHVVWPPGMALFPHDHRMWAAIGVYGGQEDNTFYTRRDDGIVASGARQLREHEVLLLGDDVIHAVSNPRQHAFTAAIHVYGGDLFATPRSAWTPDALTEHAYDADEAMEAFRIAERAWLARQQLPAEA
jgi:predicted metal-dependent enzyme (double-stranded beta helix superfamily)